MAKEKDKQAKFAPIISEAVGNRLREYCKSTGVKQNFVFEAALVMYLDQKEGKESAGFKI